MTNQIEKRRSLRQKTFLLGRVFPGDLEVVIVDLSDTGARIFLNKGLELPRRFDLQIKRRKTVYQCEFVRASGDYAGIRFLAKSGS